MALLIAGFVAVAAWARRGFFVDFNDDDQVVVYQGRPGGLLWFEPTAETAGDLGRDELTEASAADVDERREFSSVADATIFIRELDRLDDEAAEGEPDTGDASADRNAPAETIPATTDAATPASTDATPATTQP